MFKGLLRNKKKGPLSGVTKENIFLLKRPFVETDPTVPQYVKDIAQQDITDWVTGFNNNIISGTVTGDNNKTITLTRRDGSTLSIPFTDNEGVAADDVINTLGFNNTTGVLTAVTSEGVQITTNLDGRYSLLGHTHPYDNYDGWNLKTNGVQRTKVRSLDVADFVQGTNMSITYGAGGQVIFNATAPAASKRGTVEITTNTTLNAADHDQMTLICKNTVDINITIPTGLGVDFDCNIVTENIGTKWVQFVQGTGTTLIAPHGAKLLTDYTCNITKTTGAEVFNLQGELTP